MRDKRHIDALLQEGWRVGVIWECALKGRERLDISDVVKQSSAWITSNRKTFELTGRDSESRTSI